MALRISFFFDALLVFFFFFNDTATTEIYTLSLHDALPISPAPPRRFSGGDPGACAARSGIDRKSTRLNSSHLVISYAVFCLKKKKTDRGRITINYCRHGRSRQSSSCTTK